MREVGGGLPDPVANGPLTDYVSMARRLSPTQFAAACPFLFLIRRGPLMRPGGATPTHATPALVILPTAPPEPSHPDVLAVRKVQEPFPSMITIGRTMNNDVVVRDVSVSKFHAFFRLGPQRDQLDLFDAGSRNGTWIAGRRLGTRGGGSVSVGETVGFGPVHYELLEAGACWDRLNP
ncbi:MAG: FHA domain-containing protein [Myxococcales bacterium]|nr:FHA domain-containing protein [Myxococcales bacterium]